jgi:hypothetical protein
MRKQPNGQDQNMNAGMSQNPNVNIPQNPNIAAPQNLSTPQNPSITPTWSGQIEYLLWQRDDQPPVKLHFNAVAAGAPGRNM